MENINIKGAIIGLSARTADNNPISLNFKYKDYINTSSPTFIPATPTRA